MSRPTYTDTEIQAADAIIGCILNDPSYLLQVPLEPEDFPRPFQRTVWEAIRTVAATGASPDAIAVAASLESAGGDGHFSELAELVLHGAPPSQLSSCCRVVLSGSTTRAVLEATVHVREAFSQGQSGDELLGTALGAVNAVKSKDLQKGTEATRLVRDRLADIREMLARKEAGEGAIAGAPTGLSCLDSKLGGYNWGIPTILAGRPGSGKSSLALQCAVRCSSERIPVLYFSPEETEDAIADRLLSRVSGVSSRQIRTLSLSDSSIRELEDAARESSRALEQFRLDSRAGLTVEQVVAAARRDISERGTRLFVLDMVGRLRPSSARFDERQHLDHCANILATTAKQDNTAWLLTLHLNRECEKPEERRIGYRPQLKHLRMSDTLAMHCKTAIFVWRPAMYSGRLNERDEELAKNPRYCELLVVKNNMGPTGLIREAEFVPETMEFVG